jgi:hypothetical protein
MWLSGPPFSRPCLMCLALRVHRAQQCFMQHRAAQDILYTQPKELTMTLKLKLLRITRFALQEFSQDNSKIFTIILDLIEQEHLKHERQFTITAQQ